MRVITYIIKEKYNGKRVVDYLKNNHGYSSRSITKIKKYNDGLLINGEHTRTIDKIKTGDELKVTFHDIDRDYIFSDLEVEITYEDKDVVIYNKPPYMPSHTSRGHIDDTLANVYAKYCKDNNIDIVFRPLNRLDKDTSGAVVCAKNRYVASKISGKFDKVYTAIVCGNMKKNSGTIDLPIIRENDSTIKRIVSQEGQKSITHYNVVGRVNGYDLVDFTLETGRTHQIRVHMSHIGYPLLGDKMYGVESELIARQALHCKSVSFTHPITKIPMNIICNIHNDMKIVLKNLGFKQYV